MRKDEQLELLPGTEEFAQRMRLVALVAIVAIAVGGATIMQCAGAADPRLEAERERQDQANVERWGRIRDARARDAKLTAALRDSLTALKRTAPATRAAIAAADSARRAVRIRTDTNPADLPVLQAGDTTRYSTVSRLGDDRDYAVPTFLVSAYVKNIDALNKTVTQLLRTERTLELAQGKIARDSLDRIRTDSLVRGLQLSVTLGERAIAAARRAGRVQGFKAGVATATGLGVTFLLIIR